MGAAKKSQHLGPTMKITFYLSTAAALVCITLMGCFGDKPAPKPKAVLKATVKVAGQPDRVILMQETEINLPPHSTTAIALPQTYVEPKNTPADHTLMVPHQVLELDPPAPPKPEFSVLKKLTLQSTCRLDKHVPKTCTKNSKTTTCAKRKCEYKKSDGRSNTRCKQNPFNGRGRSFSFGGFGF